MFCYGAETWERRGWMTLSGNEPGLLWSSWKSNQSIFPPLFPISHWWVFDSTLRYLCTIFRNYHDLDALNPPQGIELNLVPDPNQVFMTANKCYVFLQIHLERTTKLQEMSGVPEKLFKVWNFVIVSLFSQVSFWPTWIPIPQQNPLVRGP